MYQNEINQKARQLSKVLTTEEVPTLSLDERGDTPQYDGSFKTVYVLVRDGLIKLLTQCGQVVGISVDSGTGSIEQDNLAGMHFAKAYSMFKAMKYVQTAFALKNAGVHVDDINEENGVHIYLYRQGKVLDEDCNTLVELTDEQLSGATMVNIRQLLDQELENRKQQSRHETPSNSYSDDLPEELDISEDEVIQAGSIANYLRDTYNHYLAKGHDFSWDYDEGVYHVFDIEWGRKIY